MKIKLITLLFICVFLACVEQEKQKTNPAFNPSIVEARGKIIDPDSIKQPTKKLAGNPIKIKVGKSPEITTSSNIKQAFAPIISVLKSTIVITPGQNGVPLPDERFSKGKTFQSGIPEIITVKDAYSKDINPDSFTAFGTIQGLKHNQIRCLIQDTKGNLWFSNDDGVTRYDGKYLTHFSVKNGLSNNIVLCMMEDREGSLWFGTFGGGVTRYDGKFFTHFTKDDGLTNNIVNSIIQDKKGNYWFATSGGGISKFDGEKFMNYTASQGLGHNEIRTVFEDNSGIIWFGTFGNGATSFDGTSFTNYDLGSGLPGTHIVSIFQDRQQNLWFGTYSNGAIKFDGKYFSQYTTNQGLSDNNILCMIQDHNNSLWFGTTRGGISKFDGEKFTHYTENEGLTNNYVRCALIDKQGNMWFGTRDGGLVKFNGNIFTHFTEKEGLANGKILNIFQDKNQNFWFGAFSGGVTRYDGENMTSFSLKEGLLNDRIYSTVEDKNGDLWFASDGRGVAKYDGQYFYHYTYQQGLCHDGMRKILIDRKGNFWFCSYGGGVSMFDGKYFTNYSSATALGSSKVLSMLEDKAGNLWFGTDDRGAVKFDGEKFTRYSVNEGFSHNSVASIIQDKEGNIWFGTSGGGLTKFDGKVFLTITEKEGLTNDYVTSLYQDRNRNIWIGTRLGVNVLEPGMIEKKMERPEIPLFKSYSYEDGFLGIGCNMGAVAEDPSGTIWIGSTNRLTAIHPRGEVPDSVAPVIQLTNIQLFNKNIPWLQLENKKDTSFVLENGLKVGNFKFTNVSNWYHLPENLSLPYNNNFMTFSFIGISQKQNQRIKYQYQLEGLDEKWSSLTERTEVSYGNLKPGEYIFKVKAMNGAGLWSNEFHYNFTIRPPWWNTWWFYILAGLAFIVSIMSYIKWREKELEQQNIILEQTVKEQTFELASKNTELQNINEELVTINSEKDKFFSIISHDVRGPLSAFLSLTEIMADDLPSFTLDEIQHMTGAMRNSAANLLELFGNLLEWSRMQRGLVVSHPEELMLKTIIAASTDSVMLAAQNKAIRITIKISEELKVSADKNILSLIIRNLISNAVKFTPQGGDVHISAKSTENNLVEISISDNGIGMKKQLLNNLFRIDENTSRPGTNGEPSTGLGLLLCKDFVEMQGGQLWAESTEGKGSTFYLTLKKVKSQTYSI